jgi:ABC-2 type transport system ATP-binding protein
MIEVQSVTKLFGEVKALDNLSFKVGEGKAFGLLGRNGAGKTTTIRIIMDIFNPDRGSVLIDGATPKKSQHRIGYLPEERGLYQKRTVEEQMVYIGELRGLTREQAAKNTRLRLDELEALEYLKRKLGTLSKGNQQKIQLALALVCDPDILILDEPFSGLDPVNARLLKEMVRKQVDAGKTVIFSSHQMPQVEEFCDEICIVDKGRAVLCDRLDAVKRGYPRNVYYVQTAEAPDALLESVKAKLGPTCKNAIRKGAGIEVTLSSPSERGRLFGVLSSLGEAPEVFAVKEPTLEEIFVEKVGSMEGVK